MKVDHPDEIRLNAPSLNGRRVVLTGEKKMALLKTMPLVLVFSEAAL